jgi:hypothetical protein
MSYTVDITPGSTDDLFIKYAPIKKIRIDFPIITHPYHSSPRNFEIFFFTSTAGDGDELFKPGYVARGPVDEALIFYINII